MDSLLKSPSTLAILLGAAEFPLISPSLAKASFQRSVDRFASYLRDWLEVPPDNIRNCFDSMSWPGELEDDLGDWIKARHKQIGVTDLFFFYAGHGVIDSGSFYMATRRTAAGKISNSGFSSKTLKNVLYTSAPAGANLYVILDCCYSASAHQDFQDTSSKSSAILYTSSGARAEAVAAGDETYTRFADALFAALTEGIEKADEYVSFRALESKVDEIYRLRHPADFVKPQLGAPNAPKVNVLELPVFPNPAYKAVPQQCEYYSRWIRRWGIPEGLAPLTPDQVKTRQTSTRITREQGRVRKVETVNSAGLPAPNYYNAALLGSSSELQDQECTWEFTYNENGNVSREEVRNPYGRLLYRCEYSAADQPLSTARYFLRPSDVVTPRTKSGAAFVRMQRDDSGFNQRLEFFDGFEHNQPDDLGSYGRQMELTAQGLELRTTQLDRDGKPAPCKEGYAITEFQSNPFGDTTSQAYFDSAHNPALCQDGYHKALVSWTPEGNLAAMEYFGVNGQRVLAKQGYSIWKASYDAAGNQIRQQYLDLDGEPVFSKEGYAASESAYDTQGRIISVRYLDGAGLPAYSADGLACLAFEYDATGPVNDWRNLEADGITPALDRDSLARISRTLNSDGAVSKEFFYGAAGELKRNRDGVAGYAAEYDSNGNQIVITWLELNASPGPDNAGIAKVSRIYDDRRRITRESYFDSAAAPAENSYGFHALAISFDETGRKTTRYFDRNGAPAFQEGFCAVVETFDDRGNLLSRQYRDESDQPCWHMNGSVSEQRTYDMLSRHVAQRYFGLDGKPVMTSLGYAGWNASYDDRSNPIRKVFLDTSEGPIPTRTIETSTFDSSGNCVIAFSKASGERVLDSDGVAERRVAHDPLGHVRRTCYWSDDGHPVKRNGNYASWEGVYDRFGNKIKQSVFDENGQPAQDPDGASVITWTFDERQNRTSETLWDQSGNRLVLPERGYAGWQAVYDDRGNEIQKSFFGADGQTLVDSDGGFARLVSHYASHPRVLHRQWFRASGGDPVFNLTAAYDAHGGRTETSPGEVEGTVIQTYDRAGNQVSCEYLAGDGTRLRRLEGSLAFSRFEEDFDRYNRSVDKRYYDVDNKLFLSVHNVYDPVGQQLERMERRYGAAVNRVSRTLTLPSGSQVEMIFLDGSGNRVADEAGRWNWIETLDSDDRRVKIEYFDIDRAPACFQGSYWSSFSYDKLGCLTDAVYSFPLDEDSVLNKKFRLGPKGSPHVNFQSIDGSGVLQQRDAWLVEYAMREGDQQFHLTTIEQTGRDKLALLMQQTCLKVNSDGAYVIRAGVAQAQVTCDMLMTRTGNVLQCSPPSDFTIAAMPAHPVSIGDEWQMKVLIIIENPFTGKPQREPLTYSYRLRDVVTTDDGLRLGVIDATCPLTRVPFGPAAGIMISTQGVSLFAVEKGFLFMTRIRTLSRVVVGAEETDFETDLTLEYVHPQQVDQLLQSAATGGS